MNNMSSEDFTLMMAYDQVEPFGPQRDDLRMGIALSNYFNSKIKDGDFTPRDFMPFVDRDEPDDEGERMTAEETAAFFRALMEPEPK